MLRRLVIFGFLFFAPAVASAAAPTSPKPWLEAKIREAKALADRPVKADTPAAEKWKDEARALIDGIMDWEGMISRSLGSHWDELEPAEQKRFFDLVQRLIKASFQSKLRLALEEKDKRKQKGQVDVKWLSEEIDGDEAKLAARVKAEKKRIDLEFDLTRAEEGWRLFDLTIDGTSTVRSYRSSFRRVRREEGWDGLIERLQSKLEDVEAGRGDFSIGGASGAARTNGK